ncbi:unnamed protein product [Rhizoctonia solani]|uniref:Chitin-binding type-3 domain-containing protein n=1 Tax=Rhizoctonia solani TaxID=456999 RepID=A0A8H3DZG6_9AGAM|nr:unnamed protein product [Rhizoctonia solani]
MVNSWEPGVDYNLGDVVEFQGVQYRIIQPHFSQGDWTPNVTPALWGREYGVAPSQPQQSYNQPPPEQRPWDQHDQTKVEFSEEEKQKNWWDLDPERQKQLAVGGGLLAGAALLGGGFLAYKKHKENEEEKKALAWGLQNWVTDAQRRAQEFHQHGPRGPVTWLLTKGNRIPQGAFVAGHESDGTPLYFGRTFFEGGVHPGKVSPNFQKGFIFGYDNDEIEVEDYEILIANPDAVRWAEARGTFDPQYLGATPVEGGREQSGPLYLVQAPYKEGTHPGKTGPHLRGADITYGGKEKIVDTYRVLVYNQ